MSKCHIIGNHMSRLIYVSTRAESRVKIRLVKYIKSHPWGIRLLSVGGSVVVGFLFSIAVLVLFSIAIISPRKGELINLIVFLLWCGCWCSMFSW